MGDGSQQIWDRLWGALEVPEPCGVRVSLQEDPGYNQQEVARDEAGVPGDLSK